MNPMILRLLMGLLGGHGAHKGLQWLLGKGMMQGPRMSKVASALKPGSIGSSAVGLGGFVGGDVLAGSMFGHGEGPSMNATSEQAILEEMSPHPGSSLPGMGLGGGTSGPPPIEDLLRIMGDQRTQGLI